MNIAKQWYVLAYDIRDPKRLQRLHYYLKQRALPLQRSVFLLHKRPAELHTILRGVRQRIHKSQDDVRLYPVKNPHSIWAAGQQAQVLQSIYGDTPSANKPLSSLRTLIKTLFEKVA